MDEFRHSFAEKATEKLHAVHCVKSPAGPAPSGENEKEYILIQIRGGGEAPENPHAVHCVKFLVSKSSRSTLREVST